MKAGPLPDLTAEVDWRRLSLLLLWLFLLSLALRLAYSRLLFEDDGLWFTAAEQLIRGKVLYREIYFDKPPMLPLVYAALFRVFGEHILTIRIFTAVYVTAVSGIIYILLVRLYGKREAVFGATAFTFFSTCFLTGHAQGLNTDFLMTLPYATGFYFYIRSLEDRNRGSMKTAAWLALASGVGAGFAFHTNPKGIFDLLAFAVVTILVMRRGGVLLSAAGRNGLPLLALSITGFLLASAPFIAYLAAAGALRDYYAYVWKWGTAYARYYPLSTELAGGLRISLGYFAVVNTLTFALAAVVVETVRRAHKATEAKSGSAVKSNKLLLAWLVVSFTGLAIGGRFFAHYFFEILPVLCATAGRGIVLLLDWIGTLNANRQTRKWAYSVAVVLIIGLGITLVRFHKRTAVLAVDYLRGTKSAYNANWYYEARNQEERRIAAAVRDMPDTFEAMDSLPRQSVTVNSETGPSPDQLLFVWGYRPEVYAYSGLIPASRFLSTQPLTGVPADVQYENLNSRSILSTEETARARKQLIKDLSETRPKYIVDEAGMYNLALSINSYPEMQEFMSGYRRVRSVGLFMLYVRRDLKKQGRNSERSLESGSSH